LKSLQRKLITHVSTVFLHLLELICSEASLSWWWKSERWCNWCSSNECISICMFIWFSAYDCWLNCVTWSCLAACSDKYAANLCTFLLSESQCLLFWMLLQRDAESDYVMFQVCILCLTVFFLFLADIRLMLWMQFLILLLLSIIILQRENNWRQRSIEAYDISNRSTSYRAQSYDQNKLSFDSIASQMTASQVKNRKLKFFALT